MDGQKIFEDQQHFFYRSSRHFSVKERLKWLQTIDQWIVQHEAAIIDALAADFNKPPAETRLSEIKLVRDEIRLIRQSLPTWTRPQRVPTPLSLLGTSTQIVRQPKGPALIIGAWNYPFTLTIGPLLSAIAAGCTAVVKPSEMAPATSRLVAQLTGTCFDPSHITTVEGGIPETQDLLEQPWRHIFFTGSRKVGKIVMAAAAKHLSGITLELGGENPVIIHRSANIKHTAEQLVWGKFFNGGQTCIAPNHLFVDSAVYDDMKRALQDAVKRLYQEQTRAHMACLINEAHYHRMETRIEEAINEGARWLVSGDKDPATHFMGPSILTDVPLHSRLIQEEIFGPVLSLIPYDDVDDILPAIDRQEPALALYVFGRHRAFIQKIINSTTAGTTVVNSVNIQFANPHAPFGGVGGSGMGKGHGRYGFEAFTHPRTVVRQSRWVAPVKFIFPPYTKSKQRLIRWMIKWL